MGRGRGNKDQSSKKKNRGSAGQNRASSDAYLEKNASKDGVEVLPSGLQVEEIEVGDGEQPWEGCLVTTHQRTWFPGGKVIQDTFKDNRPEEFPLGEAIPGFREGLLRMRVGGRCKLTVPPELAWGKKGTTGSIGPNQVLVFDVRLVGVSVPS